jgi:asparagine synthase (glutamine-hydrolysing)
MCGIAGLIDPSVTVEEREQAVLRMCTAMIHRGPDDAGMASRGPATIGMRRLAIFDPANGHQPMTTPDGRHTIVFNGAIYNFRILQAELESAGWTFRTRCDTEILLAALAQWGQAALNRLRGMFAFALWDASDDSLLLARDPFGIKPLYFTQIGQRLSFASEISALIASGVIDAEIDPVAVADYLAWLAVPAPRTIYSGILSLQPGECLKFNRGRAEIQAAWTFRSVPSGERPCTTRAEFTRELRARLDDTIQAHVLADVPVGAFLSGGLDSAVVAGLMSRASGNVLKTFSIGFEEDDFSEADLAEASARHFGAIHHTRILTGGEVASDMDKFLDACDQPTGDGVNTYYASQTAQEGGVKVALSGLGGDELFGGYPSFRTIPALARRLPAWQRIPSPLRAAVTGFLGLGGTRARKLSDFLANATDAHELSALSRRVFSESRRASILSQDAASKIGDLAPFHPRLQSLRAEVGAEDLYSLISAWELRTYMADVLLRDSDVMSMRHSLELRVPFIDRPLIEWLWRQPAHFKGDHRHPKSVLAEATSDILPPGLMNRRKRGFTLPFPTWMRKDLRPFLEDTFSASNVGQSGFFSAAHVQALWKGFLAGSDNREWSRVWSLAVLIAFINRRRAAQLLSADAAI